MKYMDVTMTNTGLVNKAKSGPSNRWEEFSSFNLCPGSSSGCWGQFCHLDGLLHSADDRQPFGCLVLAAAGETKLSYFTPNGMVCVV